MRLACGYCTMSEMWKIDKTKMGQSVDYYNSTMSGYQTQGKEGVKSKAN